MNNRKRHWKNRQYLKSRRAPYRRRRSELDDIYFPNYEDDSNDSESEAVEHHRDNLDYETSSQCDKFRDSPSARYTVTSTNVDNDYDETTTTGTLNNANQDCKVSNFKRKTNESSYHLLPTPITSNKLANNLPPREKVTSPMLDPRLTFQKTSSTSVSRPIGSGDRLLNTSNNTKTYLTTDLNQNNSGNNYRLIKIDLSPASLEKKKEYARATKEIKSSKKGKGIGTKNGRKIQNVSPRKDHHRLSEDKRIKEKGDRKKMVKKHTSTKQPVKVNVSKTEKPMANGENSRNKEFLQKKRSIKDVSKVALSDADAKEVKDSRSTFSDANQLCLEPIQTNNIFDITGLCSATSSDETEKLNQKVPCKSLDNKDYNKQKNTKRERSNTLCRRQSIDHIRKQPIPKKRRVTFSLDCESVNTLHESQSISTKQTKISDPESIKEKLKKYIKLPPGKPCKPVAKKNQFKTSKVTHFTESETCVKYNSLKLTTDNCLSDDPKIKNKIIVTGYHASKGNKTEKCTKTIEDTIKLLTNKDSIEKTSKIGGDYLNQIKLNNQNKSVKQIVAKDKVNDERNVGLKVQNNKKINLKDQKNNKEQTIYSKDQENIEKKMCLNDKETNQGKNIGDKPIQDSPKTINLEFQNENNEKNNESNKQEQTLFKELENVSKGITLNISEQINQIINNDLNVQSPVASVPPYVLKENTILFKSPLSKVKPIKADCVKTVDCKKDPITTPKKTVNSNNKKVSTSKETVALQNAENLGDKNLPLHLQKLSSLSACITGFDDKAKTTNLLSQNVQEATFSYQTAGKALEMDTDLQNQESGFRHHLNVSPNHHTLPLVRDVNDQEVEHLQNALCSFAVLFNGIKMLQKQDEAYKKRCKSICDPKLLEEENNSFEFDSNIKLLNISGDFVKYAMRGMVADSMISTHLIRKVVELTRLKFKGAIPKLTLLNFYCILEGLMTPCVDEFSNVPVLKKIYDYVLRYQVAESRKRAAKQASRRNASDATPQTSQHRITSTTTNQPVQLESRNQHNAINETKNKNPSKPKHSMPVSDSKSMHITSRTDHNITHPQQQPLVSSSSPDSPPPSERGNFRIKVPVTQPNDLPTCPSFTCTTKESTTDRTNDVVLVIID